jgi:hypothetical protein
VGQGKQRQETVIKKKKAEGVWGIVEVEMCWWLMMRESYFVQKLLEGKCVRGIGHDGPYRYDGKINRDNDNLSGRCCNQERHTERNENRVYVHYKDEEKENRDTQKYEENIVRSRPEKTFKRRLVIKNRSWHMIY